LTTSASDGGGWSYAALLEREDAPPGSSWRIFGPSDDLGTLNFLTEASVLEAARLVRRGKVFNLDHPIGAFDPPPAAHREAVRHEIIEYRPDHLDDYLENFFLQGSSHIDGFRHVAHAEHGFYNGAPRQELTAGSSTIGIDKWVERGIVGRGVLLDVARYFERSGRPLDHERSQAFDAATMTAVAADQGVELRAGDILLLRTDWPSYYSRKRREGTGGLSANAGIAQSRDVLSWIWDSRFSVLAADNFALEAYPPPPESPFYDNGLIHPELIAMLGLVIGELWALDDLADDCAEDEVYEFMVVLKPLNLVGAVGSPANATAIK
jgi:hypothetical protein